ncbi:MAG TPA: CRISPR system precrRNA processing endoribonuclease RAMP protein Cas6 [Alphaproteobacteria bacterium]|nr:CRISPR system precrRNA processing endoribonuclease RAMP protein Cas6 [Alphaproteobacteria bacterium]
MPYALVLHCFPQRDTITSEDLQGQKALALFLQELIQKQEATLAARLHAPRQSKPFTTAILPLGSGGGRPSQGAKGRRPPHRESQPRDELKVRFTLLDDALYPVVSQFFLQHIGGLPILRLGQVPLVISKVAVTPESGEPWAGFCRFDDLLAQTSADETAWHLRFATPTAFRAAEADLPLPIPRLCFQSWLNSWDEYAPCPFFTDRAERRRFLEEVVEAKVSVTFPHLRMAAEEFYFDGHRTSEQGFTGSCRFSVRAGKTAPHHRQILSVLARYSFYAGTGRKTTMGMGVTTPVAPSTSGSR